MSRVAEFHSGAPNGGHICNTFERLGLPDRVPISQKVLHLSAQLILTKARWFVPGSISLLSFITIALLTAATTFTVLDNYPALIQWEKNSSYIAIAGKIFWSSFLIAAPFLWCVALIVRRPIC